MPSELLNVTPDGAVFMSPNRSSMPFVPVYEEELPEYTTPLDTKQLMWAYNAYPQLAFVIVRPTFHTPLFQRLGNVTIEAIGDWWHLAPSLQQSWLDLEKSLYHIAYDLLA
ncbi:hypothetical protein K439DRAFT_1624787 [Ramaria rubella]|nr:hypothetical protein K439DRAFT_1624787 [Ramaria rubella]